MVSKLITPRDTKANYYLHIEWTVLFGYIKGIAGNQNCFASHFLIFD